MKYRISTPNERVLMYHAACKVEFQPFNRLYSQLTFFNFLIKQQQRCAAARSGQQQHRLKSLTKPAKQAQGMSAYGI